MKKVKIQIKSVFGKLLFEYESENNTIKKTLEEANLRYADLRSANLSYADLSYADLSSANLRSADLRSANLRSANLRYANLSSANLRYADLRSADLKKIKHLYQIIPEEGSFIGWKKCSNSCLVKIEIPSKAKRHNVLGGRKCRASYIKTIAIYTRHGNEIKECNGMHDIKTIYKVGRLTKPNKYDPNPLVECSHGIHFFVTKQEAINW